MITTILICATGAQPLALHFSDTGCAVEDAIAIARVLKDADEVYAVRVFYGEELRYQWGGE